MPQELLIDLGVGGAYSGGTLISHSVKGMGGCPGHRSWLCSLCALVPLFHSIRAGHCGMESSYP